MTIRVRPFTHGQAEERMCDMTLGNYTFTSIALHPSDDDTVAKNVLRDYFVSFNPLIIGIYSCLGIFPHIDFIKDTFLL